eukprot:SAG25_NODE_4324_length_839_cov_1.393243_1_plen_20_part_10
MEGGEGAVDTAAHHWEIALD